MKPPDIGAGPRAAEPWAAHGAGGHGTVDGKRLETTYSHLSALQVTAGRSVTTGQSVGFAGSTGLSTGPHLHFEVLLDGQYTDPTA